MRVGKRMTKNPITVCPSDILALADARMQAGTFRRLPVVDEGELVGILSQHDLRNYRDRLGSVQVSAAMTPRPVTISSSATLEHAMSLLSKHNIGGLPVVDGGKLVGIITTSDLWVPEPLLDQRTEEPVTEKRHTNERGGGDEDESVKLAGVIIEAMRSPSGSSLDGPYDIPFQLSRVTSPEWEQEFLKAWDGLTSKGQTVMASVGADRIILNSTTIDNVERVHLDTLKRAVAEANRATREAQEKLRRRAELEEQKKREHLRHVQTVVERLNFND